jgi:histidine triad (HIT) family protein
MEQQSCVFCKIISREISSKVIMETSDILVILDINPQASIHYLIIPKRHIVNLKECAFQDTVFLGSMLLISKELSNGLQGSQDYRLTINNGYSSGQRVFHMHMHFLAGDIF